MKNYERRLKERIDELKWLYMELYNNEEQFIKLCNEMRGFFESREATLKKSDMAREKNPDWYKAGNMLGMCLYIDNFGKNIKLMIGSFLPVKILELLPLANLSAIRLSMKCPNL